MRLREAYVVWMFRYVCGEVPQEVYYFLKFSVNLLL
jgi:hypothetical protein